MRRTMMVAVMAMGCGTARAEPEATALPVAVVQLEVTRGRAFVVDGASGTVSQCSFGPGSVREPDRKVTVCTTLGRLPASRSARLQVRLVPDAGGEAAVLVLDPVRKTVTICQRPVRDLPDGCSSAGF